MDWIGLIVLGIIGLFVLFVIFAVVVLVSERLLFRVPRGKEYKRLMVWISRHYGKPPSKKDLPLLENFMRNVLNTEKERVGEKKTAGLKKYIESKKYLGLIKNGH